LLELIKWKNSRGQIEELRVYNVLSTVWKKVSALLKLDDYTITNIETIYRGNPEDCFRDVMKRWLDNDKKLSADYKCTWNGLIKLAADVQHSRVSDQLKKALEAGSSSFKTDIQLSGKKSYCLMYTFSSIVFKCIIIL